MMVDRPFGVDDFGIDPDRPATFAIDPAGWPLLPSAHASEARTCDAKQPYLAFERAHAVARRRLAQSGDALRIYACPFGLHWHLTKKLRVRTAHDARWSCLVARRPVRMA